MTLEIKHTSVFERNWKAYHNPSIRYIVNQGGSRSSKSISILQCLLIIALQGKVKISIVRQTLASCKSIMEDFINLLYEYNIYERDSHNKSSATYELQNGSVFEFMGVSDSQKLRGKKRDILFCNEANEIGQEEWMQLMLRTNGKVFIDFNPSETEHWVYNLINEPQSKLIKSTYKDNPFLERYQIEYIENLINVDENYYKVYVLGEKPISESRIYTHFKQYNEDVNHKDFCYGLDFGYNHPCSLIQTWFDGNKVYVKELIYKQKLTTSDLISEMKNLNLDRSKIIYCDSARPDVIEELRRNGFSKAQPSNKNVKEGISKIKSMEVYIHFESTNLWKEYRLYSWKVDRDRILDEPVKLFDDGLDAMRYAVYTHHKSTKGIPFIVR